MEGNSYFDFLENIPYGRRRLIQIEKENIGIIVKLLEYWNLDISEYAPLTTIRESSGEGYSFPLALGKALQTWKEIYGKD